MLALPKNSNPCFLCFPWRLRASALMHLLPCDVPWQSARAMPPRPAQEAQSRHPKPSRPEASASQPATEALTLQTRSMATRLLQWTCYPAPTRLVSTSPAMPEQAGFVLEKTGQPVCPCWQTTTEQQYVMPRHMMTTALKAAKPSSMK